MMVDFCGIPIIEDKNVPLGVIYLVDTSAKSRLIIRTRYTLNGKVIMVVDYDFMTGERAQVYGPGY